MLISEDDILTAFKNGKVTIKEDTPVVTLESIAVSDAKTEYTVGDEFVKPTVTATYSDDSTDDVTELATFSGYDMSTAGTQTVTVEYEGKTTTYQIVVKAAEVVLESIAVSGQQTEYTVGDEFVKPTVTATYSDGSTVDVTEEATFTGYDMSTAGTQTVTVVYGSKTITYQITVAEPAKEIAEIYVVGPQTIYNIDDAFSAPEVWAKYTNEYYADEKLDVDESAFTGYDMSTAGEQTVTVTYGEFTTTYTITVSEEYVEIVKAIAVKLDTAVTSYEIGDDFVAPTIIATYTDDTTKEITTGVTFTGYDMNKAGTQTVTATYEGKTTTYEITVGVKKIVSIAIDEDKTKDSYYKGASYKTGDAVLKVTYEDGTVESVNVTEAMLTGFKTTSVGTKLVTVTYEGFVTTYYIEVEGSGSGPSGGPSSNNKPIIIIGEEEANAPSVLKFSIGSTKYTLNNKAHYTDAAFYLKNDRTMVPIRFIAETLGYEVTWNEATQTVTIDNGKTEIVLVIGSTTMYINGSPKIMDVAPELTSDRTFVPVRFVAEGFGGEVGWEEAEQMVTITIE